MKRNQILAGLMLTALLLSLLSGCKKAQPQQDPETPAQTDERPETEAEPSVGAEDQTPTPPEPAAEEQPDSAPQEELPVSEDLQRYRLCRDTALSLEPEDPLEGYENHFAQTAAKSALADELWQNWEKWQPWVENPERIRLYGLERLTDFLCVLSDPDDYDDHYFLISDGVLQEITPSPALLDVQFSVSAQLQAAVLDAKQTKALDRLYFNDDIAPEHRESLVSFTAAAKDAFLQLLSAHAVEFDELLAQMTGAELDLDENHVFYLTLTGESPAALQMAYVPGKGAWIPGREEYLGKTEQWRPDEALLTQEYLRSLLASMEIGMTDLNGFEFSDASALTQAQLWLMFSLLSSQEEQEACYREADGAYHVTQAQMDAVLSRYLEGYRLDITKNTLYDARQGEVIAPMLSGFGGGRRMELVRVQLEDDIVTASFDVFLMDGSLEASKVYRLRFGYGSVHYLSALPAAVS